MSMFAVANSTQAVDIFRMKSTVEDIVKDTLKENPKATTAYVLNALHYQIGRNKYDKQAEQEILKTMDVKSRDDWFQRLLEPFNVDKGVLMGKHTEQKEDNKSTHAENWLAKAGYKSFQEFLADNQEKLEEIAESKPNGLSYVVNREGGRNGRPLVTIIQEGKSIVVVAVDVDTGKLGDVIRETSIYTNADISRAKKDLDKRNSTQSEHSVKIVEPKSDLEKKDVEKAQKLEAKFEELQKDIDSAQDLMWKKEEQGESTDALSNKIEKLETKQGGVQDEIESIFKKNKWNYNTTMLPSSKFSAQFGDKWMDNLSTVTDMEPDELKDWLSKNKIDVDGLVSKILTGDMGLKLLKKAFLGNDKDIEALRSASEFTGDQDALIENIKKLGSYDYEETKEKLSDGGTDGGDKDFLEKKLEGMDAMKDGEVQSKHTGESVHGAKDFDIANTISQQLGGNNRISAMTGAKNFVAIKDGLAFKFPRGNYITIVLNGKDLYDVTFYKLRGSEKKLIKEYNNIYADMLKETFESQTGLYLTL